MHATYTQTHGPSTSDFLGETSHTITAKWLPAKADLLQNLAKTILGLHHQHQHVDASK